MTLKLDIPKETEAGLFKSSIRRPLQGFNRRGHRRKHLLPPFDVFRCVC
jgi:hypothetical protein